MEIFEPLKEEILERWSLSLAVRIKWEGIYVYTRKWAVTGNWASKHLDLGWCEINLFVYLSHPVYGIFCYCLVAKSCLTLATLWTVTPRLLCPTGFLGQKYWSGLPFFPPGDLSNPDIEPESPALQADSLPRSHGKPVPSITIDLLTLR